MAGQAPQLELVKNNLLRVYHPQLLSPSSYMTVEKAAGQTAITLANNDGFTDNDPVLFEGFGQPLAEIKDITASPAYGTAIAVTATTFAHSINTPVFRLPFNQIEISGTNTSGGTKTVIATIDINPSHAYTEYDIAGGTAYLYYYVRYYNSYASSPYYGSYSDEIEATDFGSRTVGFIRRQAFQNIGVNFGGWLTPEWIYDNIYFCEVDVMKEKEVWGQLVKYDYDIGGLDLGVQKYAMPSDIDITKTNRGVLGIRIGAGSNISYVDWKQFKYNNAGKVYTTLATVTAPGESSLTLTDTSDLEDEGVIDIFDGSYIYTIEYDTNTRSTNTISDIVSIRIVLSGTELSYTEMTSGGAYLTLSSIITAASPVWQNVQYGTPTEYSVNDGYIYFNTQPDDSSEDRTIWMDYFRTASRPNSDGDEVLFNDSELYVKYLEMKIKKRKNDGSLLLNDDSLIMYSNEKKKLVARDKSPYTPRIVPEIPC